MFLEFSNPGWLLFLLLLLFVYHVSRSSLAELSPRRRKAALALRLLIFLLVILALAGLQGVKQKQDLGVIFLLDVSDSMRVPYANETRLEHALGYVRRAVKEMGDKDLAGLVVFGSEAYIEMPPGTKRDWSSFELASFPSTRYTDISRAMELAAAAFPEVAEKRIVLLSDGNENLGSAVKASVVARAKGVEVYAHPLETPETGEVLLEDLILPETVKEGETFEVKVVAWSFSSRATKANLKLYRDNAFLGGEEVLLSGGKNVFRFSQRLDKPGFHLYEAVLEARDTVAENNLATGFTVVKGRSRVLYVEGARGQERYLAGAVASSGVEVEVRSVYGFPTSLMELLNYDALILSDVSALNLSEEQLRMVQRYVRDFGGGLIMIGGENSFGAGGYLGTPVEEALPVSMDVRKEKEFPNAAIALVIDKSGSMGEERFGVQKMELAREAAVRVVELLGERDRVFVVAFDSASKVVVPMQRVEKKGEIIDAIASLRSGGGTDIYPALRDAIEALRAADAKLKHIILLSDGRTRPADFYGLVMKAREDKITVSSVAVGMDADVPLMMDIAKWGNGRFYYTDDPRSVPRIFTKEALLASTPVVVEETFTPVAARDHGIIAGIPWHEAPPLRGYVATTPKELAELILLSPRGDPLLASWRYGLGRALAFTSDAKARWASEWLSWEYYQKFWAQAVRYSLRSTGDSNLDVRTSAEGSKYIITVDALDARGEYVNFADVRAGVVSPGLEARELELRQVAPGRYQAAVDAGEVGAYLLNVVAYEDGELLGHASTGFVVSYSPEYRSLGSNTYLLTRVVETTGGEILGGSDEDLRKIFQHRGRSIKQLTDLWMPLLTLALLLIPLDIALRRVMLGEEHIQRLRAVTSKLRPEGRPEPKRPSKLSRLLAKKPMVKQAGEIKKIIIEEETVVETQKFEEKPGQRHTRKLLEVKKRRKNV